MKEKLKNFFLKNRIGKRIIRSIAVLNTFEGIVHLVVASIGAWGLIDIWSFDFRVWLPVVENFVFGLFSILTGYVLGMEHKH